MLPSIPFRSIVPLILSFAIAFPPNAFAKATDPTPAPNAGLQAGIPAVIIPIQTTDGQVGEIRITTETPDEEMRAIPFMAAANPENFILAVGPEDRLFPAVAKAAPIDRVITFVANKVEDFPIFRDQRFSPQWRGSLAAGFAKLQRGFGKAKYGLTVAMSIGGLDGAFTFHASSALPQAVQVDLASTALNGFQVIFAKRWNWVMDLGSRGTVGGRVKVGQYLAKVLGRQVREMNPLEKRAYETLGKFASSFVVNVSTILYVLKTSGAYESPDQVLTIGLFATTDVSDSIIDEREKLGIVTARFAQNYGYYRAIFGKMVDVAQMMDIQGATPLAATLTFSTFVYSIFGREIETKVFMPTINTARRVATAMDGKKLKTHSKCELLLAKFSAPKVAELDEAQ